MSEYIDEQKVEETEMNQQHNPTPDTLSKGAVRFLVGLSVTSLAYGALYLIFSVVGFRDSPVTSTQELFGLIPVCYGILSALATKWLNEDRLEGLILWLCILLLEAPCIFYLGALGVYSHINGDFNSISSVFRELYGDTYSPHLVLGLIFLVSVVSVMIIWNKKRKIVVPIFLVSFLVINIVFYIITIRPIFSQYFNLQSITASNKQRDIDFVVIQDGTISDYAMQRNAVLKSDVKKYLTDKSLPNILLPQDNIEGLYWGDLTISCFQLYCFYLGKPSADVSLSEKDLISQDVLVYEDKSNIIKSLNSNIFKNISIRTEAVQGYQEGIYTDEGLHNNPDPYKVIQFQKDNLYVMLKTYDNNNISWETLEQIANSMQ